MGRKRRPLPAGLEDLRRRLEAWRRNRTGRNLPEEIWERAAEYAHSDGVNPVARALGLSYKTLRQHVESLERRLAEGSSTPVPTFVEVEVAAGGAGHAGAARGSDCVVELTDAGHSKLTVRLTGASTSEAACLAATLWQGRQR